MPPFNLYMTFVDMRNFLAYIPEEKRAEVVADYDNLTFTVQGFKIGVCMKERTPYSRLVFTDNGAPFQFTGSLHFDAVPSESGKTDFHFELKADLNLMMKMLLGGKLREAMDKIVDGLVAMSEGRMPEGLDEQTLAKMRAEMERRAGDAQS